MSGKELHTPDSTAADPAEQGPRIWVPLSHAKVDPETRDEVARALEAYGFDNPTEGFRLVMKSFARSPLVRDAVRDSLHLAVLEAPESAKAPAA